MKITKIKSIGKRPVYDISVANVEHYILKNGVVTHNTGITYSADNIWILGRQQDKDDDGLNGYHFVINVEKSRFVKEKSKIKITVGFDKGICRYSGLLDVAVEGGYVIKPKQGWYVAYDPTTKKELSKSMREAQTSEKSFWDLILKQTDFAKYVEKTFSLSQTEMLRAEESSSEESEADDVD